MRSLKTFAAALLCLLLVLTGACTDADPAPADGDEVSGGTDGDTFLQDPDGESGQVQTGDGTAAKDQTEPAVVNIVNKAKLDPNLNFAAALETIYEDGEYTYYFNYIISPYITVYYSDGSEENIKPALASGRVLISDLDRFGIAYNKESKGLVTQQDLSGIFADTGSGKSAGYTSPSDVS